MENIRMKNLMQSEIRNMSIECEKVNGINLSQGICDLPLENILSDSVHEALELGYNRYTRYDGIERLRQAIARKATQYNKIKANPDDNVIVSCGATGALYNACMALLSPGDEVLLFEPFYGYHEYTLHATNLVPVYIKLKQPEWNFSLDDLEKAVTPKTRAIIISTPSNPCGKVFSYEELEKLGDFCINNDLLIFSDEIYEYITYDGIEHVSPGSIEKIRDRVVTIGGYSKTFSITGWRIGYSLANSRYTSLMGMINDLVYVCAPAPLQFAVAKAIETLDDNFYNELKNQFTIKRKIIVSALQQCGLSPYIPEGAYYVMADISKIPGKNSKDRCMYLLENTGIAAVPGESFYNKEEGGNLARFCFAKEDDVLYEAAERMIKFFKY